MKEKEFLWNAYRKNLRNTATAHMNHVKGRTDAVNVSIII
jgi:hypothetical protein